MEEEEEAAEEKKKGEDNEQAHLGLLLKHQAASAVPLIITALWNNPAECRDSVCWLTLLDPADSPTIVTMVTSPPKPQMLSLTHIMASL